MPKYKVYWVERYVSEVEADSEADAEEMADCTNSIYLESETEGIEEVKDATPMDGGEDDSEFLGSDDYSCKEISTD